MRAVRMGMCVVMGLIMTSPVFAEDSPDYLADVTRQMQQQRQQDATDRQHRIMQTVQTHNEVRRPMTQRRLVIQRRNNRSAIFKAEQDYRFYRDCLAAAAAQYGCAIHAYVLMTNHVHLLLTPHQPDSIPKTLQSLGRRYVQYFNFRRRRTGTLWEGRYRATLIDSAGYLLTCSRPIELNPVWARMVGHARLYPWASYRWHAEGKTDALITDHRLYRALGKTTGERQRAYRELCRVPLEQESLIAIREATNKGWVLGSTRYKKAMAARLSRRVAPLPKGRPRKQTP